MSDAALSAELGRRSARGSLVLALATLAQLLVAVATTMVMARLLTPAEFGVFAMAMIAYGLFAPIRDFGLPLALVHHRAPNRHEMLLLFRINLLCSGVLAMCIGLLAWPLSAFFGETELRPIIVVLALLMLIRGSVNLQSGLLQRRMAYETLAAIGLLAQLAGSLAGIAFAMAGEGTWALVWQFSAITLVETVLYWWLTGWRPDKVWSRDRGSQDALRSLLVYGRNLSGSRLVADSVAQLDRVIVGRLDGAASLGLYQNALRWVSLPLMQLLQPMRTVCISGFSRLQGETERYREFVRVAFCITWSLTLPIFIYLAWQADVVIALLLGEQWLDAIPLFRVLAIAMLMETVDRMANWISLGEGRTLLRLRWNLVSAPVLIAAMLVGGTAGALGVAIGLAVSRATLAWPVMHVTIRDSSLRHSDVWYGLKRPMTATVFAFLTLTLVSVWVSPAPDLLVVQPSLTAVDQLIRLFIHGTSFVCLYCLLWVLQPGGVSLVRFCLVALIGQGVKGTHKRERGSQQCKCVSSR